jgi:hypothetical protein
MPAIVWRGCAGDAFDDALFLINRFNLKGGPGTVLHVFQCRDWNDKFL